MRSPRQNRLIVLVGARAVGAYTDADPMQRGVEASPSEGVPRLLQHINPFRIVFGKGERVLDLNVEPSLTTVLADTLDYDVIERIAERCPLRLKNRSEITGEPSHRCLAQHGGNKGRGDACFRMCSTTAR